MGNSGFKKKRISSIYAFNILELGKEKEEDSNALYSEANPPETSRCAYQSVSHFIRKQRKEKLSPALLGIKKKLARLYELYECCYFLCIFKLDARAVNNFLKDIKTSKNVPSNLNDLICIYDDECLVEIRDSWLLPLGKRLELHEKLFRFLKYIESRTN